MFDLTPNPSVAFFSNQQDFLVSCFGRQFVFFVDGLQMLTDILLGSLKQPGHVSLSKPNSVVLKLNINFDGTVGSRIDKNF